MGKKKTGFGQPVTGCGLVYMHPGCQTSIFGKNNGYYIGIFTIGIFKSNL